MRRKRKIKSQSQGRVYLRSFLVIFLPLALLLAGALAAFYYSRVMAERESIKIQVVHVVEMQKSTISRDFMSIGADILNFSDWHELQEVLEGVDPNKDLAKEYLSFSRRKRIYDQIRFLDETGMEIVRVNFNNGRPYIVPDEQLQNKAHRYYFSESFKLGPEEIFVSPFDLNIENGEIEQPLEPIIRFGTPVFDKDGKKRGIMLVNYLGEILISTFERNISADFMQSMLLNKDSFWLRAPNPKDEWGFMYKDGKGRTFGNAFPQSWRIISSDEAGQFYTAKGLFVFATVYPLFEMLELRADYKESLKNEAEQLKLKEYLWKIVAYVPMKYLRANSIRILGNLILLYGVLLILLGAGSWLLAFANTMRRQAQKEKWEATEKKSKFTSMVSHELRTPLTAIKEGVAIVLDGSAGEINEDQKDFLDTAKRNVDRLHRLINDVLDFTKLESGKVEFRMEDNDINETIEEVVETQKAVAEGSGLYLKTELSPEIEKIRFDSDKIVQVLNNLINNAIKFTDKGGITITSGKDMDGKAVRVQVEDTGTGIKKENLSRLFVEFQQLGADAYRKPGGTGLGLAICKQIIEGHGGTIRAESEEGRGSKFIFTLPIKPEG